MSEVYWDDTEINDVEPESEVRLDKSPEDVAFTHEYHWFYGLDEYFKFTGHDDQWQILKKALLDSNWYRIRDVLVALLARQNVNPSHTKAWVNVLLRQHLDVELKPQLVATLIRKYMNDDKFIVALTNFIQYWAGDGPEKAVMPDLNDFLSRGQVKSKLWMVTELAKIIEGPVGNIAFYGGWYNFTAFFFYQQFNVNKIYSIDLDEDVKEPSKRLYQNEVTLNKFIPVTLDVTDLSWRDNELWFLDYNKRDVQIKEWHKNNTDKLKQQIITEEDKDNAYTNMGWRKLDTINMVVNTSCEHMDNTWFDNLPEGTFVVLQTNDYFENEQHSNCCKDLEDAKSKYPMKNIFYAGELDTNLYNRFMLIGIK